MNLSVFQASHKKVRLLQLTSHGLLAFTMIVGFSGQGLVAGFLLGYIFFHLGHNIGAHRYFCHRQFKTGFLRSVFLHFMFTLNVLGSCVGYTLIHRQHHRKSDKEDDPHSPHNSHWSRSYLFSDFGSSGYYLPPKEYGVLLKNPVARFFHRFYFLIIFVWILFLYFCFGFEVGVVYGFAVPSVTTFHMSQIQVVFAHVKLPFSYQPHATNCLSRNTYWLKPLFLGDEMHNNHHFKPSALNQNLSKTWLEFDPIYYVVKVLFANDRN